MEFKDIFPLMVNLVGLIIVALITRDATITSARISAPQPMPQAAPQKGILHLSRRNRNIALLAGTVLFMIVTSLVFSQVKPENIDAPSLLTGWSIHDCTTQNIGVTSLSLAPQDPVNPSVYAVKSTIELDSLKDDFCLSWQPGYTFTVKNGKIRLFLSPISEKNSISNLTICFNPANGTGAKCKPLDTNMKSWVDYSFTDSDILTGGDIQLISIYVQGTVGGTSPYSLTAFIKNAVFS